MTYVPPATPSPGDSAAGMSADEAVAYIQGVAAGQIAFDAAQMTEALRVIGPLADADPESPLTSVLTLGLVAAQQNGLTATMVGGQIQLSPADQGATTAPVTGTPTTPPPAVGATGITPQAAGPNVGYTPPPTPGTPTGSGEEDPRGPNLPGTPPNYVGVYPGYTAPVDLAGPGNVDFSATPGGPIPSTKAQMPPRYTVHDISKPAQKDPTEIRRIQKDLERAGLLEPGTYQPGLWDTPSKEAYTTALGMANESGDPVQTVLNYMATLPKQPKTDETEARLKEIRQFVPSDPATLAQTVKKTFRSMLGREPTPAEVRQMAAQLGGFEKGAFNEETGRLEDIADAQEMEEALAGAAGGSQVLPGSPVKGPQAPGTGPGSGGDSAFVNLPDAVPSIDPVARFLELFDQKYGPEMKRNDAVAEYATQRQNLLQSLVTMSSMIGGAG
jgi:hypothetical protein